MGQATVDLPDPLQSPAAPATAGTDDLLAQLAGDEIERLLAETETERPAAAGAAPAAMPAGPVAAAPPGQAPLPQGTAVADASAMPAVADPKEHLANELDALFQSLETAASPSSSPPPPPPAAAMPVAAAPVVAPAAPPDKAADVATSSAELKALGEPIPTADSAAVTAAATPDGAAAAALEATIQSADARDDSPPSLLIRLLELINSPLGHCSDAVRQTVGKIAIATLLNAIAVLVYALIFRHR